MTNQDEHRKTEADDWVTTQKEKGNWPLDVDAYHADVIRDHVELLNQAAANAAKHGIMVDYDVINASAFGHPETFIITPRVYKKL